MDYLSQVAENGLSGSMTSTLFCGPALYEDIEEDILKCTRDRKLLKVPLDQKNFDHNQSKKSIMRVLRAMKVRCRRWLEAGERDRKERASLMRYAFEEWKETSLINDLLLFYGLNDVTKQMWEQYLTTITLDGMEIVGAKDLVKSMVGRSTMEWYWNVNKRSKVQPSLTGNRLGPGAYKDTGLQIWSGCDLEKVGMKRLVQAFGWMSGQYGLADWEARLCGCCLIARQVQRRGPYSHLRELFSNSISEDGTAITNMRVDRKRVNNGGSFHMGF